MERPNDFARQVEGWRPKVVAGESELARLEATTIRGTCCQPLLVAGDIAYVDRSGTPEPGDLVSFRVGSRFCEAQNSTGDGSRATPGDRWIKMLHRVGPYDALMENRGQRTLASFACCENPDDPYELRPVRNVRRNGVLLYEPVVATAAEFRPNAATDTYLYSTNIQQLVFSFAGSGHNPQGPLLISTAPNFDCTAIITASLQSQSASGTGAFSLEICYDDTGVGGNASGPGWRYSSTSLPISSTAQNYALQWQFAHSRSNQQCLAGLSFANFGGSTSSCYFNYITLQVEYIKR